MENNLLRVEKLKTVNRHLSFSSISGPFPSLEPICCSMSGFNYCVLTSIQTSQEAGMVIWYSHLLENFPQLVVIYRVKVFRDPL